MVDTISALTNGQYTESTTTYGSATLGKEDFLNLLVTQMQYQDPLDPIKNEQFVAQMAQFSSLEQLMNLNDTMSQIQMLETSVNNSQAVNLIGKNVTISGNALQITAGSTNDINYVLGGDAEEVTINIFDSDGKIVRTIDLNDVESGKHELTFDGHDSSGNALADGDYTFTINATDADGEAVGVSTFSNVKVDGITFEDGIVYLLSGDSRFMLSDIVEVREG